MRRGWQTASAALSLALSAGHAGAQDGTLARNLAATCAGCHGTNGQARGDIRTLAGLPAEKIVSTLQAFRAGTVPATVMQQISKGYSDAQIQLVAAFFSAQKAAP